MVQFTYRFINFVKFYNILNKKNFQYWKDEFLQWEPRDYDHATEIFLSSSDIWIPEFSLYYRYWFFVSLPFYLRC